MTPVVGLSAMLLSAAANAINARIFWRMGDRWLCAASVVLGVLCLVLAALFGALL